MWSRQTRQPGPVAPALGSLVKSSFDVAQNDAERVDGSTRLIVRPELVEWVGSGRAQWVEESAALIAWDLSDGARCTVAAVGGSFEVYLVREGTAVQVKRFTTPGPAFDAARAWRREPEVCSEEHQ